MKSNRKTNTVPVAVIVVAVLLTVLLFGGCKDVLNHAESGNVPTGTGWVELWLSNGGAGGCTVLPVMPEFSTYGLSAQQYSGTAASGEPVTGTITGSTGGLALSASEWVITAIGYVAKGEVLVAAAKGESARITVRTGETVSASITLSAITDAGKGSFSYNVL
jgi:hypothetical protein